MYHNSTDFISMWQNATLKPSFSHYLLQTVLHDDLHRCHFSTNGSASTPTFCCQSLPIPLTHQKRAVPVSNCNLTLSLSALRTEVCHFPYFYIVPYTYKKLKEGLGLIEKFNLRQGGQRLKAVFLIRRKPCEVNLRAGKNFPFRL